VERLAVCFHDEWRAHLIKHDVVTPVGQRVSRLHSATKTCSITTSCHDPTMAVVTGNLEARREDCSDGRAQVDGRSTSCAAGICRAAGARRLDTAGTPVGRPDIAREAECPVQNVRCRSPTDFSRLRQRAKRRSTWPRLLSLLRSQGDGANAASTSAIVALCSPVNLLVRSANRAASSRMTVSGSRVVITISRKSRARRRVSPQLSTIVRDRYLVGLLSFMDGPWEHRGQF
jgi:hypothetical protein